MKACFLSQAHSLSASERNVRFKQEDADSLVSDSTFQVWPRTGERHGLPPERHSHTGAAHTHTPGCSIEPDPCAVVAWVAGRIVPSNVDRRVIISLTEHYLEAQMHIMQVFAPISQRYGNLFHAKCETQRKEQRGAKTHQSSQATPSCIFYRLWLRFWLLFLLHLLFFLLSLIDLRAGYSATINLSHSPVQSKQQ